MRRFISVIATAALLGSATGANAGPGLDPGFVITPASQTFGAHRLGTTTERTMHVRGRTCAEIDPARPKCEDMIFPAIAFHPPRVSKGADFEVVQTTCGIFGVASPTGNPCTVTVAFAPTRKGLRKGRLGTNVPLRGKGIRPRKGSPKNGEVAG